MKFVQVACSDERVLGLGSDGVIYELCHAQVETGPYIPGSKIVAKEWVRFWDPLDCRVGKDAAIQVLKDKQSKLAQSEVDEANAEVTDK